MSFENEIWLNKMINELIVISFFSLFSSSLMILILFFKGGSLPSSVRDSKRISVVLNMDGTALRDFGFLPLTLKYLALPPW